MAIITASDVRDADSNPAPVDQYEADALEVERARTTTEPVERAAGSTDESYGLHILIPDSVEDCDGLDIYPRDNTQRSRVITDLPEEDDD